jgi:hypothetical protein
VDWNVHMANTALLNKVVDARVFALAEKAIRWRALSAFASAASS